MNVVYCAVFGIPDRVLLAETINNQKYYENLVSPIINKIIKSNSIIDSYEIENEKFLNFVKHKHKIILLCISNDHINSEKYKTFFIRFKDILINAYGSIEKTYPSQPSELCLQETLNQPLEKFMKEYESVVYTNKNLIKNMNSDLDIIKADMNKMIHNVVKDVDDLKDLELKAMLINQEAQVFHENSQKLEYETRCMKPWMWVLLAISIILIIAWICWCETRCGQFFSPFC